MQIEIAADFTLDQLLDVLGKEPDRVKGFLTSAEWQKALGIGQKRFYGLAREAKARGLLGRRKVVQANIADAQQPRPAYKFLIEKGKANGDDQS